MALNTNYYEACDSKRLFLTPRWGGSDAEMLAFARQCATTTNWGGHVPLVLLDAHREIAGRIQDPHEAAAYWRQKEVWKDVHQGFEKFFALNPGEIAWRHNYAKAAYDAGQWKVFEEQCQLMGPVNYRFFGGQEPFRLMKEEAGRHLREGSPSTP